MKFNLGGIRRILRRLGNPERAFPCVHIAGSNGKGSTAAMIASILTAAGYRTGLYTSPHVSDFSERIRVDGRPVSRPSIVRWTRRLRRIIEREGGTFFEAATAMAFAYFKEQRIDVAVVETGLGGRLDATNVVRPLVSVITSVSREHTQILGTTLSAIAREKAGIIKQRTPCIIGERSPTVLRVMSRVAKARNAPVYIPPAGSVRALKRGWYGSEIRAQRRDLSLNRLRLSLAGVYQEANLRIALETVLLLKEQYGFVLSKQDIRRGLAQVRHFSGIRARMEVMRRRPMVILDVGHNPDAARRLERSLRSVGLRNLLIVFGVMRDKDARSMLRALQPAAAAWVFVQPRTPRAVPASELASLATRLGIHAEACGDVHTGVQRAMQRGGKTGRILITGSHFVVGEALARLEGKNYLTINQ